MVSLAGAYKGVDGLRPEWVKSKANSPMQEELAQKLEYHLIKKRGYEEVYGFSRRAYMTCNDCQGQ